MRCARGTFKCVGTLLVNRDSPGPSIIIRRDVHIVSLKISMLVGHS